ncbi:MAG: tRNA (N6-threonylcarbamoyladenosine(37)-N6)-methyltransferase TrmO [Actinomycetaceae bacterium]|nr:tRNA (N6-threonylcarbamoyladenosine(37)-N6)-methyltransferase TrmO [Actinomycetaceae bacterium]
MYEVVPIGVIRSPFKDKKDAPIQGAFEPDARGFIEIDEEYVAGLLDIDQFSHLIVLYWMDRARTVDLRPIPFLDDAPHGIFATRNPRRPNKIGLMVVALERVEGNVLYIGNVDALDGTPVIDVKPYVPRFDSVPHADEGWFAGRENRPKPEGRE